MRRGAESVDADPLTVTGDLQRAPADEAGAQKRCERDRISIRIEVEGKGRVGDHVGGEPAIASVAGEDRRIAQVLTTARTVGARSAGVAEPRHANATSEARRVDARAEAVDDADDLVTRYQRQLRVAKVTVNDMQVGPADGTGLDPQANFAISRHRIIPLDWLQSRPMFSRSIARMAY